MSLFFDANVDGIEIGEIYTIRYFFVLNSPLKKMHTYFMNSSCIWWYHDILISNGYVGVIYYLTLKPKCNLK